MKTLYISDLDGTLLKNNLTISEFTADVVNELTNKGMIFSYATARSIVTAAAVTNGITVNIPVIVHNGAFVMESGTKKLLVSNFLSADDAEDMLEVLLKNGIFPMVNCFINGKEKISYCQEHMSNGVEEFIKSRPDDIRLNPVSVDELVAGEVFHFTCIDCAKKLKKIYEEYKGKFQCIYYIDIYTGNPWLEILPKNVTKGKAILELKRILGCERVVAFGDGENDIEMFEVADECYAVDNASDVLKKVADGIIDSNERDGVAKWLIKNYR